MKFSPSTGGFYPDNLRVEVPVDCVTLTQEQYQACLTGQASGKVLHVGTDSIPVPVDPTIDSAEMKRRFVAVIQTFMDHKAQERGYDDIRSAALRAAIVGSPFHAEGLVYAEWMDRCWSEGYTLLAAVEAGGPVPTPQDVIAAMPALVLPIPS